MVVLLKYGVETFDCSSSIVVVKIKMDVQHSQQLTMDSFKTTEQSRMVDCYLDMSLNNICRVCLEKNQSNRKMCNIFENSKSPHFAFMIMACASIQILEGDGLPTMICNKCIGILNIAWQFKQQCENSDAKLRQYFGNSQHLQITPDLESFSIIKEEQSLFPLPHDSQLLQSLLQPQQHPQTPMQQSPALPESDNQLIMQESQQQNIDNFKKPKPVKKDITTISENKQDKLKDSKQHQCDTCGKTFNRREYLTQHIRIHTGEKPYHCHICEKRFINSGHLTTHMRTHTGERPHGCTLCPKAFSTRQELNKHNMVHSGERPFVCKLCGKRFGSSSNLYSHLKHHTGEKNFTCEHCGKAFYTKQELKQHFVVHTGEKAFLCEFCNKRFSQIAHLRRHSKLHK